MSYTIPIEVKTFSKHKGTFKDFIKKMGTRNNSMIFLSENCYSWLKENSMLFEEKNSKILVQCLNNTRAYIETINIVSSNCSFLKSLLCDEFYYEYLNGIPSKIFVIILEDEKKDSYNNICATVIEPEDTAQSPVNCIMDYPNTFDDSIVFLDKHSYQRLKRNTNTVSNLYNLERLTWLSDERYPGGNIMLHCLNCDSLYAICSMNFPFFHRNFHFDKVPKAIYFIA